MPQEITIEVSQRLGCGEPERYFAVGHYSREDFIAALEAAEDVIGLQVKVPAHCEVRQAWQSLMPIDDGWQRYILTRENRPGAEPVTFVFWDEVDEA